MASRILAKNNATGKLVLHSGGNVAFVDPLSALLLHMGGTHGSQAFIDSGQYAHPVTANGNVSIDRVSTDPYGGTAGVATLDGSGDYLSVADHPALNFGTGKFTMEFWLDSNNNFDPSNDAHLITKTESADDRWHFCIINVIGPGQHAYQFHLQVGGVNVMPNFNSSVDPGDDVGSWTHLAVTRDEDIFRMYHNAVVVATDTYSGAMTNTGDLQIGIRSGSSNPYDGLVDEVRMLNGIAVDFTKCGIPNRPYNR